MISSLVRSPIEKVSRMTSRKSATTVPEPYNPKPAESSALLAYRDRRAKRAPACVKVTRTKTGSAVSPDHPDLAIGSVVLMNALGTASPDFMDGILRQLTNAASPGREPSEAEINFMLSVVEGIEPRDQVEAMLATQMAAVQMATMTFARRLAHV